MNPLLATLGNAPLSGLTFGQAESGSSRARPCLTAGAGAFATVTNVPILLHHFEKLDYRDVFPKET